MTVPCLVCETQHHKMIQTGLQTPGPQRMHQQTMVAAHSFPRIFFDKAHNLHNYHHY